MLALPKVTQFQIRHGILLQWFSQASGLFFFPVKFRVLTSELILIRCLDCRWREDDRNKGVGQDTLLKGVSAGEKILVALRYARQGGIYFHGTLCYLGWHKI